MAEATHQANHDTVVRLLSRGDICTLDQAEKLTVHVRGMMDEPHRHYHTFGHAYDVVKLCHSMSRVGVRGEKRAALLVAALYHDVVYDPKAPRGWNEAASAVVARDALQRVGRESLVPEVERLIELTVEHRTTPDDFVGQILIDADLSSFAAWTWAEFKIQNENIRAEYAHVSDEDWLLGRKAVLAHYLYLDPIFYVLGEDYEQRAVFNIVRAIRELGR